MLVYIHLVMPRPTSGSKSATVVVEALRHSSCDSTHVRTLCRGGGNLYFDLVNSNERKYSLHWKVVILFTFHRDEINVRYIPFLF